MVSAFRKTTVLLFVMATSLCAQAPQNSPPGFARIGEPPPMTDFPDHVGFTSMFDGTLKGWDFDRNLWDIRDGAIHIAATCEKPTGTVYAISDTGEYGDFILKYELKGTGLINGGMQFRSYVVADPAATGTKYPPRPRPNPVPAPIATRAAAPPPAACARPGTPPSRESKEKWNMNGPQADFDASNAFSGMNYEQGGRAVIATPGYAMFADANGSYATARLATKEVLGSWFHKDDWNQFIVICVSHSTSIYMNGHLVTQFIDMDPRYFRASGKIAIESESTGDLWARNIWIRRL